MLRKSLILMLLVLLTVSNIVQAQQVVTDVSLLIQPIDVPQTQFQIKIDDLVFPENITQAGTIVGLKSGLHTVNLERVSAGKISELHVWKDYSFVPGNYTLASNQFTAWQVVEPVDATTRTVVNVDRTSESFLFRSPAISLDGIVMLPITNTGTEPFDAYLAGKLAVKSLGPNETVLIPYLINTPLTEGGIQFQLTLPGEAPQPFDSVQEYLRSPSTNLTQPVVNNLRKTSYTMQADFSASPSAPTNLAVLESNENQEFAIPALNTHSTAWVDETGEVHLGNPDLALAEAGRNPITGPLAANNGTHAPASVASALVEGSPDQIAGVVDARTTAMPHNSYPGIFGADSMDPGWDALLAVSNREHTSNLQWLDPLHQGHPNPVTPELEAMIVKQQQGTIGADTIDMINQMNFAPHGRILSQISNGQTDINDLIGWGSVESQNGLSLGYNLAQPYIDQYMPMNDTLRGIMDVAEAFG